MIGLVHKSWKQELPLSQENAWRFFSDPHNLAKITPPDMQFTIVGAVPSKIYTGLIIEYKVSPFGGISMPWVTEIKAVDEGHYFIDEQRFGPYSFWHHQHHFTTHGSGTLMTDILHYRVPGWWLGKWMNDLLIETRIDRIFDYRSKKLTELFS